MAKRKSEGLSSKLSVFVDQTSILRQYYIQHVKDGIQIRVYKINMGSASLFSQSILVKVEKILRKSQAQFREKLRKLRLRQNN